MRGRDSAAASGPTALGPGPDAEITWLLHRAAQRMNAVTGAAAAAHGLSLRDHIVLSALHKSPGLTQVELGRALGMDKTTLTAELDRLERAGAVRRAVDPRDRRARVLELTPAGGELRAAVATNAERAETEAMHAYAPEEVATLRRVLFALIGTSEDPGSCV